MIVTVDIEICFAFIFLVFPFHLSWVMYGLFNISVYVAVSVIFVVSS